VFFSEANDGNPEPNNQQPIIHYQLMEVPMRTSSLCFVIALVGLFLVGCGSSQKTVDMSDWETLPNDPNFFYAMNTQVSQDMQLAINKATADARAEIARQVELKVNGLQKRFMEETGAGDNAQLLSMFTEATKTVVSVALTGSRVAKQKTQKEGNGWRAYVLVEYPIGAVNQALQQQIKNREELYTRFRASQAYKELDDEVQKYEEWKKQQNR
jgi:hypothetical protein